MGFRFVHAADLHLGSQFSGVGELDPDLRTRAVNSSMKALENLVEYCLESQVDFVLLAGDVFDSPAPYLRVQKHFVGQVEKLRTAGIEVFMVTGNHDANVFDSFVLPLPDNLHVFSSSQVECISRSYRGQSVTITGISYPQALVEDLSPLFPDHNRAVSTSRCFTAISAVKIRGTLRSPWLILRLWGITIGRSAMCIPRNSGRVPA